MPASLLELLGQAAEAMKDFLRRSRDFPASPQSVDATSVRALSAALAAIEKAAHSSTAEEIAGARAADLYAEYRKLLVQVQAEIEPLHGRLLIRKSQLDVARSQADSARAWAAALNRTR